MNFNEALYAQVHSFPKIGSTVTLTRGISETERNMARFPDRRYTVSRYTETGYAIITDAFGSWHVHPEALTVAADDYHDDRCPICASNFASCTCRVQR